MSQNREIVLLDLSLLPVMIVKAGDMIWWEGKQYSLSCFLSENDYMKALGKAGCLIRFTYSSLFSMLSVYESV